MTMPRLTCPLCHEGFDDMPALRAHLHAAGDSAHALLAHVVRIDHTSARTVVDVHTRFAKAFNCLRITQDLPRAQRLADLVKVKADEARRAAKEAELKVVCPLCGERFRSDQALLNHVKAEVDDRHRLMNRLRLSTGAKQTELAALPTVFAKAFKLLTDVGPKAALDAAGETWRTITDALAEAKAYLRRQAELARRAHVVSVRCQHIASEAEEYERVVSEKALIRRVETRRFQAMPKEDRPSALVEWFYAPLKTTPMMFRDVPLVKGLYTKRNLTADQIRQVMAYMRLAGERTLARVNYMVADGLAFAEKFAQADQPGTPAALVKLFYQLRGMRPLAKFFLREEAMIAQAITSGLVTFEQAEGIVRDLAASIGSPLLYFDSRVAAGAHLKRSATAAAKDDPCVVYGLEREVAECTRRVCAGQLRLADVGAEARPEVTARALRAYTEGSFNSRYAHAEWAFKIGLPLTPEMIAVAKAAPAKSWFANALGRCTDPVKRAEIGRVQVAFRAWLRSQGAEELDGGEGE